MAIQLANTIEVKVKGFLDSRQSFKDLTELEAYPTDTIPDGYMTWVESEGCHWIWSEGQAEWTSFSPDIEIPDLMNGTGPTKDRPVDAPVGFNYYDTDIQGFVVWNGTYWENPDGTNSEKVIML